MNNQQIGSEFEKDFAKFLANQGYWVHFLEGAAHTGAQPFDLIAIKNGETVSSQVSQIMKNLGWTAQSSAELAYEKMQVCMWLTIAVFVALIIITNIIKKFVNKK